jgi:hypothetical protein
LFCLATPAWVAQVQIDDTPPPTPHVKDPNPAGDAREGGRGVLEHGLAEGHPQCL